MTHPTDKRLRLSLQIQTPVITHSLILLYMLVIAYSLYRPIVCYGRGVCIPVIISRWADYIHTKCTMSCCIIRIDMCILDVDVKVHIISLAHVTVYLHNFCGSEYRNTLHAYSGQYNATRVFHLLHPLYGKDRSLVSIHCLP